MSKELKRMQELAGVSVNEVADFGSEGFKWVDSHSAPYFPAYQGFNNVSDISNKIKAYWDEIRSEPKEYDQRDWGFYIGDTIPTYFKNVYMMLANQISDPKRREYLLKGPTDPYEEEQIKQMGGGKVGDGKKAFDFLKSIPDNYSFNNDSKFNSKYLGNDSKFTAIESEFQKLFNKYASGPYLLTPMIIPYTMQNFNDIIWDNRSGVRASFDRRDKMKQDDTVPRLEENKTNKMSKELNRMQELAGVPAKKETESLNEHYMAGGIVGMGAINQIPPREKSDYEMAFEHFMTEGEEKIEETSCGSYEEDDTTMEEGIYEEDDTMEEAVGIAATPEMLRKDIQDLIVKFDFDEDLGAAIRSRYAPKGEK